MDEQEKEVMKARAEIGGQVTGFAEFTEYQKGTQNYVKIVVNVKSDTASISPGQHGCHIHEKGVCEGDFKSAGGHFDPGPAGNSDPDVNHPYHTGDLPNIVFDEDGNGHLDAISTRITLSPGPLSILDTEEGTSIMIHAHHDPYHGGEHQSGVSGGPRIGCGVIQKAD